MHYFECRISKFSRGDTPNAFYGRGCNFAPPPLTSPTDQDGSRKTEAVVTFKRLEITMRCQLLPHIFDHARLGYDTADIARHFVMSAVGRIQNGGYGNRKWK
jgi:hypothetical protein